MGGPGKGGNLKLSLDIAKQTHNDRDTAAANGRDSIAQNFLAGGPGDTFFIKKVSPGYAQTPRGGLAV